MKKLRTKIDQLDQNLLKLLAKRKKVVLEICKFKREQGLELEDKKREREMLVKRKEVAQDLGLNEGFIEELFQLIIKESKRIQFRR